MRELNAFSAFPEFEYDHKHIQYSWIQVALIEVFCYLQTCFANYQCFEQSAINYSIIERIIDNIMFNWQAEKEECQVFSVQAIIRKEFKQGNFNIINSATKRVFVISSLSRTVSTLQMFSWSLPWWSAHRYLLFTLWHCLV